MRLTKYITGIIFLLIMLMGVCSHSMAQPKSATWDNIAAIVNDEIITDGELVKLIKDGLEGIDNSNIPPYYKDIQKNRLRKWKLQEMVDQRLILQEAKRYNIKISEETIKQYIEKEFKDQGQTVDTGEVDLTELMRSRLTIQELFQKKMWSSREEKRRANIDTFVSPMEIFYHYQKHKDWKFRRAGKKVKTRIITLLYARNESRAQTLQKAEALVKELRKGADFAELARTYSNDPFAKDGGTWPRRKKEEGEVWDFFEIFKSDQPLHAEVRDIVVGMEKGAVSPPIPVDSENLCQIVKVEDIEEGKLIPFSEAQERIRYELRDQKVLVAYERMKERLRKRAFIWPVDLFSPVK
jgi:peptidyl-prolyl cis-trans isomerase SurA